MIAPLADAYAWLRGAPISVDTDEVTTTLPPSPRSTMWRIAARNVKNTPSRSTRSTRCQSSVGMSMKRCPPPPMPAFAKHESTFPNASSVAANEASTASSPTSCRASTFVP